MLQKALIHEFSNMGHRSGGRGFYGFDAVAVERDIDPRAVRRLVVEPGDLLQIEAATGHVALWAFDAAGHRAEGALGLSALDTIDAASVDAAPLDGWLAGRGGTADVFRAALVPAAAEPVVLRCTAPLTLWAGRPQNTRDLAEGRSYGAARLRQQRAAGTPWLPDPLGEVREEFTIPAGTARAYDVRAGETVQIIDMHGQQCSDFQALRLRGLDAQREEAIDSTATRSMVRRAFPGPGLLDKFYDADMRALFRVVQDTCGRHDTLGLACTARSYEERGFPGHVNCSDNISDALDPYGVARRLAWPAINFFWNTWLDDHLHILTEESFSRPGDYVAMEALDDMVCVSTACPDDIDPINGWNPTDVHVRIYKPGTRIQRAVAYRSKEDAPMQISRPSAFNDRLAPLTNHFAPARDLWAPVSFPAHGTIGEYWACREAATLQDMSGLRKFDIVGPDAEHLLQLAMTRDIERLAQWRGTYAVMCDDSGGVIDDGTLFRLGEHLFRWCCGSEESGRHLGELARENGFQVRINALGGALPNLALQGPKSRDILRKIVFTQPQVPDLDHLRWFGCTVARLHDEDGAPFMLTRSGYTGELGYEIFCAEGDALRVWDALMEAGAPEGLVPMGSAALELLRMEAGLASIAEFSPGTDVFEAGLGFAVDMRKSAFVGRAALERNAAAPRRLLRGLKFAVDDVPRTGAPVFCGERQVGVVTSACHSPMFGCTIAMAQIAVEQAEIGTELEVGLLDGRMKRLTAQVTAPAFFDPKRERARA
ncbi:MAG: DUF1989 domain-containing protein [Pseudomonadota bacterium]